MDLHPSFVALVTEWYDLQQQIEKAREAIMPAVEKEKELRKKLADCAFVDKNEGSHSLDMPEGWKLKAVLKLDRKVDEKAVLALPEPIRKGVFRIKHELEMKVYRELTAEQQKAVDVALTVKPAMPTLELVAPDMTEGK